MDVPHEKGPGLFQDRLQTEAAFFPENSLGAMGQELIWYSDAKNLYMGKPPLLKQLNYSTSKSPCQDILLDSNDSPYLLGHAA